MHDLVLDFTFILISATYLPLSVLWGLAARIFSTVLLLRNSHDFNAGLFSHFCLGETRHHAKNLSEIQ